MRIDLTQIYSLKEEVLIADFGESGVLFDLDSRRCVELNRTGIEIIGYLNGHDPLSRVKDRLAVDYDQPEDRMERDLAQFIESLLERNLIDGGQGKENKDQG